MLNVNSSSRFDRDLKRCIKRGYDLRLLLNVVNILRIPAALPARYKNHPLKGNYSGKLECHIAPDWLLIYEISDAELYLARTGTHADLFGE